MAELAAMDADERELFAEAVGAATGSATGAGLDAALVEIGWRDALAVDRRTAVETLFDAQGRAGSTSSALSLLLADTLASGQLVRSAGDDLATQNGVGAMVVLPGVGSADPPGQRRGDAVAVDGIVIGGGADAGQWVVVVAEDEGFGAHLAAPGSLRTRPVDGLDPALDLVAIAGEVTGSGGDVVPVEWPAAVSAAQLALAHELIGASRTMLELARTHALERIQFGRPIARFQAVRHRLAETLVAIETAEAAVDGAWRDGSAVGAQVAKAVAGRSARTVARHSQQVLAGIGFTAEHPLHTFIRRVLVLDGLFGDARTLTRNLGRELLTTRRLPPMLPL